ncbi:MAG: 1,2-phenylacetyl-CoA epoxidase subunit B [Actinomycetota bacterium]
MALYEVFLKRDGRQEYRHAGALEAANDELAVVLARETYLRRAEGDRLWIVQRDNIITTDDGFISVNADKPHRHHDGKEVAALRRELREQAASGGGAGSGA